MRVCYPCARAFDDCVLLCPQCGDPTTVAETKPMVLDDLEDEIVRSMRASWRARIAPDTAAPDTREAKAL